jgi:hypothetical protein
MAKVGRNVREIDEKQLELSPNTQCSLLIFNWHDKHLFLLVQFRGLRSDTGDNPH